MASRWRRPATVPLLAFAATIALVAAGKIVPALLEDTTATSSTPVRRELAGDAVVSLAAGQSGCLSAVPFDRDSGVAQLAVRRVAAPGALLRLTATAPGHRAHARVRLPAHGVRTYRPEVSVPLRPPARSLVGSFCASNAGPGGVELIGSGDPRALTRTRATIDGAPQRQAFSLALLDARRRSTLARTPDLVERAAALSPVGPWLLWTLIPLVVLGVPLLVGTALARSLREPDEPPDAA
jgi:hypothetical protein